MTSFLGKGWRFPIRVDATGALGWSSGEDAIRESIWTILSTPKRSRVMLPEFGCGIQDFVLSPNNAATRALIASEVRLSLTRFEPRIDLLAVSVEPQLDAPNTLMISIDYRTRANNAAHNVVYPFFINEGQGGAA
ncbi:MAG TPA: GPW/gp25 family protein [Arachnia sp.]|nr:GPW/gp25 family protein [Arachnia sp.]HMT85302.1 GPW/gp25 family protein [Arachnia sp.]